MGQLKRMSTTASVWIDDHLPDLEGINSLRLASLIQARVQLAQEEAEENISLLRGLFAIVRIIERR
jgi:hypothetical protein